MSQQIFKIGDDVHISEPGGRFDGMDGRIAYVASGGLPYRVDTSKGSDWYDAEHLTLNEHKPQQELKRDAYTPGRDAIPPQPAPKLPPVVREMETAAAKIGTQEAARASLPVQPGEVETLPNGAKQSKLGHWWSTPYAALAVARVMSEGHAKYDEPGTTPAQGNWHGIPIWSNIQHAITHLMLYAIHDKSEDHLAHAATRLMMALDQRESGREKPKDTRGDYPTGDHRREPCESGSMTMSMVLKESRQRSGTAPRT